MIKQKRDDFTKKKNARKTSQSREISILSQRIQNAFMQNTKFDSELKNKKVQLSAIENENLKYISERQKSLQLEIEAIRERSPRFKITDINPNIVKKNGKNYYKGKWKDVAVAALQHKTHVGENILMLQKLTDILAVVNMEISVEKQIESLNEVCRDRNLRLFDLIRDVNRLKAEVTLARAPKNFEIFSVDQSWS